MDGQLARQVGEVVPRPKGKTVLGTKTIFKRKIEKDGRIDKYKYRFVAQEFRQMKSIHYDEPSLPTPLQANISMVFGIAAVKDWELRQLDVDMAYLEANVSEELYIELPENYRDSCDQASRLQRQCTALCKPDFCSRKRSALNSPQGDSSNVRLNHACSGEYCAGKSSSSSWYTTTCWG